MEDDGGQTIQSATPSSHCRRSWLQRSVLPHEPWLRRWLSRKYSDQDVDDIIQDVFMRLMQTEDVSHIHSINFYIARTARSIIATRLRYRLSHPIEEVSDAVIHVVSSDTPDAHDILESRAELARVIELLDGLTPRERDVFLACQLDRTRQDDVALQHSISRASLQIELARTRAILREKSGRYSATVA